MSYADRIAECNRHDPAEFVAFVADGRRIGAVRRGALAALDRILGAGPRWAREILRVSPATVELAADLASFEARNAAIAWLARALHREGLTAPWRDEPYPALADGFGSPPLFVVERAALPFFGLRGYAVHMNGYVRQAGEIHLWVGRRSRDKPTFPGKLDNLVAGGQPFGLGLDENLAKEAWEEAAIPERVIAGATRRGAVRYCFAAAEGLRPDTLFCYDLELPADFVPQVNDGEVDSFELWPLCRVLRTIRETTDFKFNCNLVILDFALRHGAIGPGDREYEAVRNGLDNVPRWLDATG